MAVPPDSDADGATGPAIDSSPAAISLLTPCTPPLMPSKTTAPGTVAVTVGDKPGKYG